MAKATFTQADVMRAIKPALALGLPVSRYEITPEGQIVVHTSSGPEGSADAALEAWKRKRDAT